MLGIAEERRNTVEKYLKQVTNSNVKKPPSNKGSGKRKKSMDSVALGNPSTGKIVAAVFTGIFFTGVLCLGCYAGYFNLIRYPKSISVTEKNTGIYCLENFEHNLKSMKSTGGDSYISQEVTYANGDKVKVAFYKKMLGTVKYTPYSLEGINVYGNTLKNKKDEIVYSTSSVGSGERVKMSYIDYSRNPLYTKRQLDEWKKRIDPIV